MVNNILENVLNDTDMNNLYNSFIFTPMMQEWKDIKESMVMQYWKNTIVLFQLWTFYEAYFHDAVVLSKLLWFTLTKKNKSKDDSAPMAGMPLSANFDKLSKLLDHNFNIVMVSEILDNSKKSGISRVITKIITPSTNLEFENKDNSYLLSIFIWNTNIGLSFLDISTGDFKFAEYKISDISKLDILYKYNIKEIIVNKEPYNHLKKVLSDIWILYFNIYNSNYNDFIWKVEHHFWNLIEELELYSYDEAILSTFNALEYTKEITRSDLSYISYITDISDDNFLKIDKNTISNLELINTYNWWKRNSLYFLINNTLTPFWSRELRKNILTPFSNKAIIEKRLDIVEYLSQNKELLYEIRTILTYFHDIEKLSAKLWSNSINPIDILNLKDSLSNINKLKSIIDNIKQSDLNNYIVSLYHYNDLIKIIENSFLDNPNINIREWWIFKDWYNIELDSERDIFYNIEKVLEKEEHILMEKYGFKYLKIINNNQWLFIEIKNNELNNIPLEWTFIKSLNNRTRYINNHISELNKKYKLSEIKIKDIEYSLFQKIRIELSWFIQKIINDSKTLSEIDILTTFSYNAINFNYSKPIISENEINIINGRHLMIEKINGIFTANDYNSKINKNIKLITWPNMWWKSTYLKQNAIISILMQIGSFIPADNNSNIPIFYNIMSRIGASDNFEEWLSTFALEMNEMAYICKNLNEKSLVIIDEIWRWTDTKNGIALAQSFLEYFSNIEKWHILFSTHYSELIWLNKIYNNIENLKADVIFNKNNDIEFLHKIIPWEENDSYWIEIAKLQNIPQEIINRAYELKNQKTY